MVALSCKLQERQSSVIIKPLSLSSISPIHTHTHTHIKWHQQMVPFLGNKKAIRGSYNVSFKQRASPRNSRHETTFESRSVSTKFIRRSKCHCGGDEGMSCVEKQMKGSLKDYYGYQHPRQKTKARWRLGDQLLIPWSKHHSGQR